MAQELCVGPDFGRAPDRECARETDDWSWAAGVPRRAAIAVPNHDDRPSSSLRRGARSGSQGAHRLSGRPPLARDARAAQEDPVAPLRRTSPKAPIEGCHTADEAFPPARLRHHQTTFRHAGRVS